MLIKGQRTRRVLKRRLVLMRSAQLLLRLVSLLEQVTGKSQALVHLHLRAHLQPQLLPALDGMLELEVAMIGLPPPLLLPNLPLNGVKQRPLNGKENAKQLKYLHMACFTPRFTWYHL
jgi:hypothetical protein